MERRIEALDELVDGHQPWSHRQRLHMLTNAVATEMTMRETAQKISAAVEEYQLGRQNRSTRIREWGAFVLATVAVLRPWEYLP